MSEYPSDKASLHETYTLAQQHVANHRYGKAYELYEQIGDVDAAYELAGRVRDLFTMDRLAMRYDIPGHIFRDFTGGIAGMIRAVKSHFVPGATAEVETGFPGFSGKIVADIGTRDGRFIPMFRELGAADVYGVEPDPVALEALCTNGTLESNRILPYTAQALARRASAVFDIATIFNFNMSLREVDGFFTSMKVLLVPGGSLALTFAESEVLANVLPILQQRFSVKRAVFFPKQGDFPHKHFVHAF